MKEQPGVQKWLDRVSYDLDTAKAMLQTGRLIYAVFMCQQTLEKAIKALLVSHGKEVIPIHNLRRLAEKASISVDLDDSTLDGLVKSPSAVLRFNFVVAAHP